MIINKLSKKNRLLNRLRLFIFVFIFLTPFYLFNAQYSGLTILMLFFWLIVTRGSILKNLKELFNIKPLVLIFIFFLYTYLTLLWSENFNHGLWAQKQFREALMFMPIILLTLSFNEAKTALKLITIAIGIYALYTIGIYLDLYTVKGSDSMDPKGYLSYAVVGAMMTIGVFFSLTFVFFDSKKQNKFIFLVISILCLISLFINNSRAAEVSFFLVILTMSFIFISLYMSKKSMLLALITLSVLSILIMNSSDRFNNGYKEIEKVFHENKFEGSWGSRIYFYIKGIEIIKDNPLLGVGAGDSKAAYKELARLDNSDNEYYNHMHSQHLEILARYGFIGYLLLISAVVYLLYSIKENKEFFYLGLFFYISIFYNSFFNSILDKKPINILFFLIFALLLVSIKNKYINDESREK